MSKSKYNAKIVERITGLIRSDSYTIREICGMVRINVDTWYDWIHRIPEFSEAVEKAKDERMKFFVEEAKKSLLKKIQGYTVQEVQTVKATPKGGTRARVKEQRITDKHFQPDTAAIIFTLCNGDSDNWKNRQNTEITGKGGKDLFSAATDAELDAKIEALERKLSK